MTTKQTVYFTIDAANVYKALLDRICDYMETGVNRLASVDDLVEAIKILLAAKASKESDGKPILLNDLINYSPSFDGYAFEEGYAKAQASNKIYLYNELQ